MSVGGDLADDRRQRSAQRRRIEKDVRPEAGDLPLRRALDSGRPGAGM